MTTPNEYGQPTHDWGQQSLDDRVNPYRVTESLGAFQVARHYPDGDEYFLVECETREQADEIAEAEHQRELNGGPIP